MGFFNTNNPPAEPDPEVLALRSKVNALEIELRNYAQQNQHLRSVLAKADEDDRARINRINELESALKNIATPKAAELAELGFYRKDREVFKLGAITRYHIGEYSGVPCVDAINGQALKTVIPFAEFLAAMRAELGRRRRPRGDNAPLGDDDGPQQDLDK